MDPTHSYELNNNRADGSHETRVQALPSPGVAEDILDMVNRLSRRQQIVEPATAAYLMRLSALARTGGRDVQVRAAARVVGTGSIAPSTASVLSLTPMTSMPRVHRRSIEILETLVGTDLVTYTMPFRVAHEQALAEERRTRQERRNRAALAHARRHAQDLEEELDGDVTPADGVRRAVQRGAARVVEGAQVRLDNAAAAAAHNRAVADGVAGVNADHAAAHVRHQVIADGEAAAAAQAEAAAAAAAAEAARLAAIRDAVLPLRRRRDDADGVESPERQRPRVRAGGGGGVDDETPVRQRPGGDREGGMPQPMNLNGGSGIESDEEENE